MLGLVIDEGELVDLGEWIRGGFGVAGDSES